MCCEFDRCAGATPVSAESALSLRRLSVVRRVMRCCVLFSAGLIAAAGVRERVWALLLLGSRSSVTRSCSSPESETGSLFEVLRGGEEAPPVGLQHPDQPCEEMQVLEVSALLSS